MIRIQALGKIHQFDEFSVKITDLALTFFPRENLPIAKNQCHFPREKNQCHFQKFRQFDEFFRENNRFGIGFSP